VEHISAAANVPVYGFVDQYMGRGIVGGHLYSLAAHGPEAAKLALQVMSGTRPSEIALVEARTSTSQFDWRQLQRWGISESRLPAGSEIRFRPSSAWERYRWQITLAAVALVAQSLLIAALFYQLRRRRHAELEARHRMAELAHMNRRAAAGEMSASIAHELNQPLTAILSNAETVHDLLGREDVDPEEIREIIADIIEEDTRAAEVMSRVRNLLRKGESRSEIIDLNELVGATLRLLHSEFVKRKITVETALAAGLPEISADPVQLQQVLLNAIMNAMEAMGQNVPSQRTLKITTRARDHQVEAVIVDRGHGIAPEHQPRLFQPFFTTKEHGLGLGLSICAKIVASHGGKLDIENNAGDGATVTMSLPTHRGSMVPA
jgi:C4-dicarboxylate-specific signal transduction histidine kinase